MPEALEKQICLYSDDPEKFLMDNNVLRHYIVDFNGDSISDAFMACIHQHLGP